LVDEDLVIDATDKAQQNATTRLTAHITIPSSDESNIVGIAAFAQSDRLQRGKRRCP
jgi:hypothetical protein